MAIWSAHIEIKDGHLFENEKLSLGLVGHKMAAGGIGKMIHRMK